MTLSPAPASLARLGLALLALGACTPTVRVAAPDEPIVINLNVNLTAEVLVRLERTAEADLAANPELF